LDVLLREEVLSGDQFRQLLKYTASSSDAVRIGG
jgi:cell division protease FtsH